MADYHTADGEPTDTGTDTPQLIHQRDTPGEQPSLETGTALIAVDYGTGAYCAELTRQQALDIAYVLSRGRDNYADRIHDDSGDRKIRALVRSLESAAEEAEQ